MTIKLRVPKMKCEGCEQIIRDTLLELENVEEVQVSLENKTVDVSPPSVDKAKIYKALTDLGYPPEPIEQ